MTDEIVWSVLFLCTLITGVEFFVFGQTGSEMYGGAILLTISGFSLARTIHYITNKEVNEQ